MENQRKIRTVISGIHYPLSMMSYFIRAFERREDVELVTVGPFTGDFIPWSGGIRIPMRYVKQPTIPLPSGFANAQAVNPNVVQSQLPWEPDLWLQVDAGFNFTKPKAGIVAHVATDPHCISGDTLIATSIGIRYPEELIGAFGEYVADDSGMVTAGGVIRSGYKNTRKIVLETGQELVCTDDHMIRTSSGYKQAGELRVGDYVLLACGTYIPAEGTDKDYSVGFVLGAFLGDGSFGKEGFVKFTLSKEKKVEFGDALINHLLSGFGVDTVTKDKHYTCENAFILQVRRWGLYRFLKSLDIKPGKIPLFVRSGSRKMLGGFISGLLSADGCSVDGRIQITMKSETLARELQTLLFYLGIPTSNKSTITNGGSYKPNQKYHTLHVRTGIGTDKLSELVGNIPGRDIRLGTRRRGVANGSSQEFEIVEIRGAVKNYPDKRFPEPVYDVLNTENGNFLANGIVVHNCLNYDRQRKECDVFFCMQQVYSKPGDKYLPYAFDPTLHYPMDSQKEYDGCLIGLHYDYRDRLVHALRGRGYKVYYSIGEIFDEYRLAYNRARIALSWSSMDDLPARVWEALGMGLPLLTNRVSDLSNFFVEGDHYIGFSNLNEAVDKFHDMLVHPDEMQEMANAAYRKVLAAHTWDHRIQNILELCKLR